MSGDGSSLTWVAPSYRWKLWYEDSGWFSSENGAPHESPPWGVVVVTQPNAVGRDLLWNTPFYLHRTDSGEWSAHDQIGLLDQLAHYAHLIDCVRVGREMDTRQFKALVREATLEIRGR